MFITLTTNEVADHLMAVNAMGNEDGCYTLCQTMAAYLEQYEEDTGIDLELDPVGIRCEYSPYALYGLIDNYQIGSELDLSDDLTEMEIQVITWLQDRTVVIPTELPLTYIIQDF
jgi:hypothetical protein